MAPHVLQPASCLALIAAFACSEHPAPAPANDRQPAVDTIARDDTPASPESAGCAADPTAQDRTICPPVRVGPLDAATARAGLATVFGAGRIRDEPVDVGEGQLAPGSILGPGDDRSTIVWTDSTRSAIAALLALGPAWRTPEGIGVSSSLSDVVGAIGPVEVLGFGWDYGGTLMLDGTPWQGSGLFLRMEPRDPAARESTAWARVRGDRPYAATDPDVRALDLVVGRVDVRFR